MAQSHSAQFAIQLNAIPPPLSNHELEPVVIPPLYLIVSSDGHKLIGQMSDFETRLIMEIDG